ncbi:MAG: HAD-IB family phosphatase [Verrucomicrobiota bacterium]
MNRLIIFDCDSTLSSIEGVDELARSKGEEVFAQVVDLTRQAMEGEISLESVFAKRMDLIQPSKAELTAIGELYLKTMANGVNEVVSDLINKGWQLAVISGGLYPPVAHFAEQLGIKEVCAVPVHLDPDGHYLGFDQDYPSARSGGKPEIVRQLQLKYQSKKTVMVGDGVSDLETKPEVDLFVGYGEFEVREKVKAEADAFIYSFRELPSVLGQF